MLLRTGSACDRRSESQLEILAQGHRIASVGSSCFRRAGPGHCKRAKDDPSGVHHLSPISSGTSHPLCFALATGVGKAWLMGAFITYLYRQRISRHFFVLAPNLTIYNKLVTDFTPNIRNTFSKESLNLRRIRRKSLPATTMRVVVASGREKSLQARMFDTNPIHINIFQHLQDQ